jgi:putative aldouronate transport system substrate-binding protein
MVLAIVAAGAFGAGQGEEESAEAAQSVNPPGEFPIVDEPVTYEVTLGFNPGDQNSDFEEVPFTQYYEDLTNVNFEFDAVPAEQMAERRNLIFASGDFPDVIMNMSLDIAQMYQLGDQGAIQDLGPYIDEWAPNLRGVMDEEPWVANQMTAPSGGRYFLPWINSGCFHCEYSQRAYLYTPWLEELGLDTPETTEEFREMLVAFRDQDPNGNGEADELPMMGANGWRARPWVWLMNSFVYTNPESSPYLRWNDGDVEFVADTEEFREGLEYLHGLYEDDLIAPESFVQGSGQMKVFGEADDPVVGVFYGGHMGMFADIGAEHERWQEYRPIEPVAGPDGYRTSPHYPHQVSPHLIVFDTVEQPEVMVRWADWFYTLEGFMRGVKGWVEGEDWFRLDEDSGKTGLTGDPAIYEVAEGSGLEAGEFSRGWENSTVRYWPREYFEGQAVTGQVTQGPVLIAAAEANSQYDTGEAMPVTIFPPDVAPEIAEIQATVQTTVENFVARFITGEMDIESGWDAYTQELENLGVERYVELYNEYATK